MILAIATGSQAFWIQAKAGLGQVLLESAWARTLDTKTPQKAWPWADTTPVAKLTVPFLGESFVVLEGVSGEAMAFGPGRIASLSDTAKSGVFGVGGHRDSHLRFAEHLTLGSELELQTRDGSVTRYQVTTKFVADSADQELLVDPHQHALVLITCYPFNALQTGGSKRYVVIAIPETEESQTHTAQTTHPLPRG